VLQGLHRWSEPVARFCRDLELDLGHPCQVNAYITPPGAQGLDLHEDAHDVFVLQAFGRKRWEVHAAPAEAERDPLDVEVTSGDTIYLPAGTPHAARAQDVLSGHLTVGIHVTPWREVLTGVVGRMTAEMDDPVAAGWTSDVEGFSVELQERLGALASALGDVNVRTEANERRERFLSTRAQLARGTIADRAGPVVVNDDSVVARRPGSVCELSMRADRLVVLLGDRLLEMPGWLEQGMRQVARLDEDDELAVRDLALHVPDRGSRTVLVRRLVREGLLTIRDGH
jgi:bifunctional lysine-specific demethylase and histidyl-hydroxylase NO66